MQASHLSRKEKIEGLYTSLVSQHHTVTLQYFMTHMIGVQANNTRDSYQDWCIKLDFVLYASMLQVYLGIKNFDDIHTNNYPFRPLSLLG